jgi:hypothetical protein
VWGTLLSSASLPRNATTLLLTSLCFRHLQQTPHKHYNWVKKARNMATKKNEFAAGMWGWLNTGGGAKRPLWDPLSDAGEPSAQDVQQRQQQFIEALASPNRCGKMWEGCRCDGLCGEAGIAWVAWMMGWLAVADGFFFNRQKQGLCKRQECSPW